MKKYVNSALVAVALCFALMLGGCALTVNQVKKDPNAQVASAIKNTIEQLKDASPVSLPNGLDKKGTLTAVGRDVGEGIGEINASLVWDSKSKSAALDLKSDLTDEMGLYIKGNEFALYSDSFNNGTFYGANLETLVEDLKDSEIFGLLGVTYDDVRSDIEEYVNEIINGKSGEKLEELTKAVKDVLKSCENDVTEESITTGGEEVEAICVTYKLTKDDCLALADAFNETYGDSSENAEIKDAINETDFAGSVKFAINPDKKVIMQVGVDVDVTVDGGNENLKMTADLGKNPSESEEFTVSVSEQDNDLEIVYDRRNKDGKFCRKISVKDNNKDLSSCEFVYNNRNRRR